MDNLRKITLRGVLAKEYGEEHWLKINTPKDAIAALEANFPGFKARIISLSERGINYKLITANQPEGLTEEELGNSCPDLIIQPVIGGSGGVGRVLLGVALVAASIAITFPTVGGGTSLGLLGGSLILSGVSELLTPRVNKTVSDKKREELKSSSFSSATGVADRDYPIALLYGEMRITNPAVISSSITTEDLVADED